VLALLNYFKFFVLFWAVVACQSNKKEIKNPLPSIKPVPVKRSGLKSFKEIKPVPSKIEELKKKAEPLFVPSQKVAIRETEKNLSGSLYDPASVSSNFLLDNMPIGVGSTITLFVKEVRGGDSGDSSNQNLKEEDADALTKELLDGLPNLAPEEGSNRKTITKIQTKVVERLKNGDLVVEAQRSSEALGKVNHLFFRATVPSDKLKNSSSAAITDLVDVTFQEQDRTGYSERRSSGWEDEYTLRYSGFVEVPSKLARRLEGDRQSLLSMRKRLENRVHSFKNERDKIAKERSDLYSDNTEMRDQMQKNNDQLVANNEELAKIKETLADREETIKELEKEIEELENGESDDDKETAEVDEPAENTPAEGEGE
jgi:hypothetical protein